MPGICSFPQTPVENIYRYGSLRNQCQTFSQEPRSNPPPCRHKSQDHGKRVYSCSFELSLLPKTQVLQDTDTRLDRYQYVNRFPSVTALGSTTIIVCSPHERSDMRGDKENPDIAPLIRATLPRHGRRLGHHIGARRHDQRLMGCAGAHRCARGVRPRFCVISASSSEPLPRGRALAIR
jgi:hypothetical protein